MAVVATGVVQAAGGYVRPHVNPTPSPAWSNQSHERKAWLVAHRVLGATLLVGGAANAYLGAKVELPTLLGGYPYVAFTPSGTGTTPAVMVSTVQNVVYGLVSCGLILVAGAAAFRAWRLCGSAADPGGAGVFSSLEQQLTPRPARKPPRAPPRHGAPPPTARRFRPTAWRP